MRNFFVKVGERLVMGTGFCQILLGYFILSSGCSTVTNKEPEVLLSELQEIERSMGRMSKGGAYQDRKIGQVGHGQQSKAGSSSLLTLTCQDTGLGIEDDKLPHIFDRFWQHDSSRTDVSHAGIGMSIVQACSRALGLTVSVSLGESSEFRVRI